MAMRSLSNPLLRAFAPSSQASARLILFKAQSELSSRRALGFLSEAGLVRFKEISPASSSSSSLSPSKPDQLLLQKVENLRVPSSLSSSPCATQEAAASSKPCLVPEAVENVRILSSSSLIKAEGHPWLSGSSGMSRIYSLSASASIKPYQNCRLLHSKQLAEEDSDSSKEDASDSIYEELESTQNKIISSLPATKPGEKPRIVVLGTGWAASRLMKDLNTKLCDIVCISPRNHMVFTPLLASTCVGTLEFRSVAEPVVRIQSALSKSPSSYFFLGRCTGIDPQKREVHCVAQQNGSEKQNQGLPISFTVSYDKLVIAAGAQALTFNIKGVNENAIFLREVSDAQSIRRKLLMNLMLSDIPGTSEEEKRRLLHCVVVGGGPTGVEFSGELSDFIKRDVHQRYAHVQDYIHVTLIEAKEILSSFDVGLRLYAISHLTKVGVKLVQGVVKDVQPGKLVLSNGLEVPYGLLVWSTGVGPSEFVKTLKLPKSRDGRIGVDEKLRVPGLVDVYAIGDCAGFVESVGKPVLPALAQVAERQGKYLAQELNRIIKHGGGHAGSTVIVEGPPFIYKHLGSMASVGRYKALVDLRQSKESKGFSWAGFLSWLVWRSAYLTRVVSWRNRFYVAVNWATTFVFGRDISRI